MKETLKGTFRSISCKLWIYKSYFWCIFVTKWFYTCRWLFIYNFSLDSDRRIIFCVIVKRISFSFKWCIKPKKSKMRLVTGFEQMGHIYTEPLKEQNKSHIVLSHAVQLNMVLPHVMQSYIVLSTYCTVTL